MKSKVNSLIELTLVTTTMICAYTACRMYKSIVDFKDVVENIDYASIRKDIRHLSEMAESR